MPATAGTRVTQVGTVGIPVSDQDRALGFYMEKLGFEKRVDFSYGEGQRWVEVVPAGGGAGVALVRASEDVPVGIDTQVRFNTEDAEADHATLQAGGVDVEDVIRYPVPMFGFHDLDGNRLVIIERPKGR